MNLLYDIQFICYTNIEIYLDYKYSHLLGIEKVTPPIDRKINYNCIKGIGMSTI